MKGEPMKMKYHVLYNPQAGNGNGLAQAKKLEAVLPEATIEFVDVTKLEGYSKFIEGVPSDDGIVLTGGDGTLNRFINDCNDAGSLDKVLSHEIQYYAAGTGNDFLRDLGIENMERPIAINEYLKGLPTVEVKGGKYLFLNGVGYGIDGYCCEEGDRLKEKSDKPVNYTSIAIKGLLLHYKPTSATVTVDGVKHTYKHVWLAPTMNGRFYGGGMIPTPSQNRLANPRKLSVMVFRSASKLKALMVFPSIFKGEHVRKTKVVEVLSGKDITVEFDRPSPLQIDGETITGVSSYHATAAGK